MGAFDGLSASLLIDLCVAKECDLFVSKNDGSGGTLYRLAANASVSSYFRIPPPPPPLHDEAWAWFAYGEFNESSATWADRTGRHGAARVVSGNAIVQTLGGHGALGNVTAVHGTASTAISFGDVLPTGDFSICSTARYTGANQGRILQAGGINWLHGHCATWAGVAFGLNAWVTPTQNYVDPNTNWLVMCTSTDAGADPEAAIVMTAASGIISVGLSNGPKWSAANNTGLFVNDGLYPSDHADFAVAEVVIWPRALTTIELREAIVLTHSSALGA